MSEILQPDSEEKARFIPVYLDWFQSVPLDVNDDEKRALLDFINKSQKDDSLTCYSEIVNAVRTPSSANRTRILTNLLKKRGLKSRRVEDLTLFLTPYLGFPSVMATLADLRSIVQGQEIRDPKPAQASVMASLYGSELASKVYDRLEEISRKFNILAQRIAYDKIWSANDISLRLKSLVTVTVLLAIGREEQAVIHLKGFRNLGGTRQDAEGLVAILNGEGVSFDTRKARDVIDLAFKGEDSKGELSPQEKVIVKFVADNFLHKTGQSFAFDRQTLMGIRRQMIAYAGLLIESEFANEIL